MQAVDLFCGCGGASLGMKHAGVEVVEAIDTDSEALETYRANHGSHTRQFDLNAVRDPPTDIEWVHGSPPCQGFTEVGKQDSLDERNSLTLSFINWIEAIDPMYVTMENVPGMTRNEYYIDKIKARFRNLGYSVRIELLKCENYGVPQSRGRVFLLASKVGSVPIPEPTHYKDGTGSLLGDGKESWVKAKRCFDDINEGVIISGQGSTEQFEGKYRTRTLDELCNTICAEPHHVVPEMTPGEVTERESVKEIDRARKFTVREMARFQTFPDEYEFKGRKYKQRRQIGNAVPPVVQQRIAETIQELPGQ